MIFWQVVALLCCFGGSVHAQTQFGDDGSDGDRCVDSCPSSQNPVCTTRGQTYSSACRARCDGQRVECHQRCPCDDANDNDRRENGLCGCSSRKATVCGTDGYTYRNRCRANCRGVEVDHEGRCRSSSTNDEDVQFNGDNDSEEHVFEEKDCGCPTRVNYVCAENGRSYRNRCEAECQERQVACEGKCPCPDDEYGYEDNNDNDNDEGDYGYYYDYDESGFNLETFLCRQRCSTQLNRVCGSDGRTYDNRCYAECSNERIVCSGRCPCRSGGGNNNNNDEDETEDDDCGFGNLFDPVCSTRNITYSNACRARRAKATIACDSECPCSLDRCGCDDRDEKVCGINGRTYLNECKAKCAKTPVDCDGGCPCRRNPSCTCSFVFSPVCGRDGFTYPNRNCASECGKTRVDCSGECPC